MEEFDSLNDEVYIHRKSSMLQRNKRSTKQKILGQNAYELEQDGEQEVGAQQSQLDHDSCHSSCRGLEMPKKQATEIETEAIRFQHSVLALCDAAMPRDKSRSNAVY